MQENSSNLSGIIKILEQEKESLKKEVDVATREIARLRNDREDIFDRSRAGYMCILNRILDVCTKMEEIPDKEGAFDRDKVRYMDTLESIRNVCAEMKGMLDDAKSSRATSKNDLRP